VKKLPRFEVGSTVKLTDRYATAISSVNGNSINWVGRKGKVLCCGKDSVAILWEGRKSRDYVPHKAVEIVRNEETA
jgi:hypothetical protein